MPKMIRRKPHLEVLEALTAAGFNPFLARIVAGRIKPGQTFDGVNFLGPKLQVLDHPRSIKDIDKAVSRLVAAIANQEIIAIETDHDCDGQTAHAVMHTALIEIFGVPASKVQSFIGHRMKEGYGLSDAVATRILNAIPRPNVVITADNGSSDEPRIARLKEAGIDVIVTDHHHLPEEGPPKSAYACLNPTREDCDFPDDSIAGCMVAWLLMSALRQALIEAGLLSEKAPSLKGLLDYVAVGTVADCVSLSRSLNNRAVIRAGLQLISQMQRPCWQAILPLLKRPFLRAEDLGFTIGPMLNSDGRLSDAFG
ncbi:MAG: single-stranded-DNA-specific exonuclease RecJ, partial [Gammaproteobacteria bacterium]|nr:single-stranded-DNA-specific exonuclease RecJ [Gammaproteobacteria bacterium]